VPIDGALVIDVGCGSGLFSEAFLRLGARSVNAVDVDPECVRLTRARTDGLEGFEGRCQAMEASILDPSLGDRLAPADIVYAWGSLTFTGSMWEAVERASALVRPDGVLVLGLYNRHWTSPLWRGVKRVYNSVPAFLQVVMVEGYVVAGRLYNRLRGRTIEPRRGMEMRSDIRDWLGGYPYDYASPEELRRFATDRGWQVLGFTPCQGMTGVNEFVLRIPDRPHTG
jgi:2-polyprenyl-6-hydroxyphenyl methylase/3-demethylubiquinone-9 3-methyltransferase